MEYSLEEEASFERRKERVIYDVRILAKKFRGSHLYKISVGHDVTRGLLDAKSVNHLTGY